MGEVAGPNGGAAGAEADIHRDVDFPAFHMRDDRGLVIAGDDAARLGRRSLTAGTGLRFIIDLEKGKPTCEIGKALTVLQTLGIDMTLVPPKNSVEGEAEAQ